MKTIKEVYQVSKVTPCQANVQLVNIHTKVDCLKHPKIDAHVHLGGRYRSEQYWKKYNLSDVISKLRDLGMVHIIDLELFTKRHWDFALERTAPFRDFISLCAPLDFDYINDEKFESIVYDEMHYYHDNGACGFKVWKNLGLSVKKDDGTLYSLNDTKLKFIWKEAAALRMPIIIHVGDPPAFWEPVNIKNERYFELKSNPKWSYYNSNIKYDDLLKQLELLLQENPETRFIVAHMCSAPHDLIYVSNMLNAFDNLYVDMAAVLSELGRQPRHFKKFAYTYSDRILFGTDYFAGDMFPHVPYFRFMETSDEYFPYTPDGTYTQGQWNIYGCELKENVLRKIYYENAKRIFNI